MAAANLNLPTGVNQRRVARFSRCGPPEEVLELSTLPLEPPREGELLVRMLAAPINPADINFIQGIYGRQPRFPASPAGMEGCGRVAISAATGFEAGDLVILLRGPGSWTDHLSAPASQFLKVDGRLEPLQAAMLKVNPLTALRLLTGFMDLRPGDWVAQNAANSGVGRCLIQIARQLGIRTLNILRRPEIWREELTRLGADVVLGEAPQAQWQEAIAPLAGQRPRLAFNAVGGESALRLMELLEPGGTLVTYGAMSQQSLKVPNRFLIFKGLQLKGLMITAWLEQAPREEVEASYARLAAWMAAGQLRQAIDGLYLLDQLHQAIARAQEPYRQGKVLLRLSDEVTERGGRA